ncbi:DDE transposase [Parafrankia sp. BMG5.11]|nr:DDE transposase [Parafrankia sp. BMG5.11]
MRVFEGSGLALAEFLGLAGVVVTAVERERDGSWSLHVAGPVVACCPRCGEPSGRIKEFVGQRLAHLVVAPARVTVHKPRLFCDQSGCEQGSFVESGPLAARGARVSTVGRKAVGHLVGDWGVPVSRVAGAVGVAWCTAQDAFAVVADAAGVVAFGPVGEDTVVPGAEDGVTEAGADAAEGEGGGPVRRSVSGPLPPVGVLGLDEHRRGRPRYHRDPDSGRWVEDADRWLTVFVDHAGHGLLGQVEGRTVAGTAAWVLSQPAAWRAGIWAVTIDMSTVYKAAARAALPDAMLAVDPFHVTQLANKVIGDVRRRVTQEHHGRRGRADDPEYKIKGLLVRREEALSPAARGRLLCTLSDLGDRGRQITAAWRAKELLRAVLALAAHRSGHPITRSDVSNALTRFFTYCATVGETVPEITVLAETISKWRAEIANAVLHSLSNAATEGVNRLVKLVYRTAFGLRNVTNQQLRARYFASRATRPTWLHTVNHPAAGGVIS